MNPTRSPYRPVRIARGGPPIPDLPLDEHRTDDGDTDDRWASAMMLSYLGLFVLVVVGVIYSLSDAGMLRTSPADRHMLTEPPSYYLAR